MLNTDKRSFTERLFFYKNKLRPLKYLFFLIAHVAPCLLVAGAHDTTYYRKYNDKLIVSIYVSERRYNIGMSQRFDSSPLLNTDLDFQADANKVTGIELAYDKVGVSFGIKATPPLDVNRKGKTDYKNFNFSFGGNRWLLETSLRRYKGFYDNNTSNYTPGFDSIKNFYQDPNFLNRSVRAKFLYFFNHKKFSYKSAYSCNYRQLKSAFSWIVVSNFYHNKLVTDSSFIPDPLKFYYNRQAYLSQLNTTGLSVGGGFSCNIVLWKKIFANITLAFNPELQFARYGYFPTANEKGVRLTTAGDIRASIGYNGKKFFYILTSQNDLCNFSYGKMKVENTFFSGAFAFGYRFGLRTPGFYKKFQGTKMYGWL